MAYTPPVIELERSDKLHKLFYKVIQIHHHFESRSIWNLAEASTVKSVQKVTSYNVTASNVGRALQDHYASLLRFYHTNFSDLFESDQHSMGSLATAVNRFLTHSVKQNFQISQVALNKAQVCVRRWILFKAKPMHDPYLPDHHDLWRDGIRLAKALGNHDELDPLSNFFPFPMFYEFEFYPSVEHAYMCTKLRWLGFNEAHVCSVANQVSGKLAKKQAGFLTKQSDTHLVRRWRTQHSRDVLMHMLKIKLECCYQFKKHLMYTGGARISHPVRDDYWGTGSDMFSEQGSDVFGCLLMAVRDHPSIDLMSDGYLWVFPSSHGSFPAHLKSSNWDIPAMTKDIVMIGDSNLFRMPPFKYPSCQVESYPGAQIRHLLSLFDKYAVSNDTITKALVLNIGLNDALNFKPNENNGQIASKLKDLVFAIHNSLPEAIVFMASVQVSSSQHNCVKDMACYLNEEANTLATQYKWVKVLPNLADAKFLLCRDRVHWTPPCARSMCQNWLHYIANVIHFPQN